MSTSFFFLVFLMVCESVFCGSCLEETTKPYEPKVVFYTTERNKTIAVNTSFFDTEAIFDFRLISQPYPSWYARLKVDEVLCAVRKIEVVQHDGTYVPVKSPQKLFKLEKYEEKNERNLKKTNKKLGSGKRENSFEEMSTLYELDFHVYLTQDISSLLTYDKLKLKIACSNVETSDLKAYGTFEVFLMNYSTQQTKLNTAGKISGTCQHNCGQDDVDQEFQVSENVGDVYLGKLCSFISYPSSFQCTFVAKGRTSNIDYTKNFELSQGRLTLRQHLDFEKDQHILITVACITNDSSLVYPQTTSFEVLNDTLPLKCTALLTVLNVDDEGPRIKVRGVSEGVQSMHLTLKLMNSQINKKQLMKRCLSFVDRDVPTCNAYNVTISGDVPEDLFKGHLNYLVVLDGLRCVDIRAERNWIIPETTKDKLNLLVTFTDLSYVFFPYNSHAFKSVFYNITMNLMYRKQMLPLNQTEKKLMMISSNTAPFSRIFKVSPQKTKVNEKYELFMKNCSIERNQSNSPSFIKYIELNQSETFHVEFNSKNHEFVCNDVGGNFEITPGEGIVYMKNNTWMVGVENASFDFNMLQNSSTVLTFKLRFEIAKTQNDSFQDEPVKDIEKSCAESFTESMCVSSVGVGSVNGRCEWVHGRNNDDELREDSMNNTSEENSTLNFSQKELRQKREVGRRPDYSTCTYSAELCPDGFCDELERMVIMLCPQDCTVNKVKGMGFLDTRIVPNMGISAPAAKRCWCRQLECECSLQSEQDLFDSYMKYLEKEHEKDGELEPLGIKTFESQKNGFRETCGKFCQAILSFAVVIGAVAIVCLSDLIMKKRKQMKELKDQQDHKRISNFADSFMENNRLGPHDTLLSKLPTHIWNKIYFSHDIDFQKWEIDRSCLELQWLIGEGAFGKVVMATLKTPQADGSIVTKSVAVKMLKNCASASEYRDLVSEFNLLQQVHHPNIVALVGVCTKPNPFYLIVEFCKYGSLKEHLKKYRKKWQKIIEESLMSTSSRDSLGNSTEEKHQEPVVNNLENEFFEAVEQKLALKIHLEALKKHENIYNSLPLTPKPKLNTLFDEVQHNNGFNFETQKQGRQVENEKSKVKIINKIKSEIYDRGQNLVAETCIKKTESCPAFQHKETDEQLPNEQKYLEQCKDNYGKNLSTKIPFKKTDENYENEKIIKRQNSTTFWTDMTSYCWQIAKGMDYLSGMHIVHRDLAARNVLLAEEGIVKISDFGLSRDVYEKDAYLKTTKGPLPVKWMAPESLFHQVYTPMSDVWSFGVVLWEIFSFGANPYIGVQGENLLQLLQTGYRLPKPAFCSQQMYDLMQACWQEKCKLRPSFKQLEHLLKKMMHTQNVLWS